MASSNMRQDLMRRNMKARFAASVTLGVFLSLGTALISPASGNAQATTTQEQAAQPNFMGFAGAYPRRDAPPISTTTPATGD